MSHNIYILHSELSYTWMTLPLGRVTLFPSPFPEKVIQLCDTNQVHNSDEGCNGGIAATWHPLSSVNFHD